VQALQCLGLLSQAGVWLLAGKVRQYLCLLDCHWTLRFL
jgi:hypothetical protein